MSYLMAKLPAFKKYAGPTPPPSGPKPWYNQDISEANLYRIQEYLSNDEISIANISLYEQKIKEMPFYVETAKSLLMSRNKISTFKNFPLYTESIDVSYNYIETLVGIHKHIKYCKKIDLSKNKIKEGGIGLLLINGLDYVGYTNPTKGLFGYDCRTFSKALLIITKYLGKGKIGLLECQQELIDNGYEEFAKL